MRQIKNQRAIITVIGEDCVGIVATISSFLAEKNVNIEDISQTIIQDTFTMTMLVNLPPKTITIADLSEMLQRKGNEIGMEIHVHDEAIIKAMHRI